MPLATAAEENRALAGELLADGGEGQLGEVAARLGALRRTSFPFGCFYVQFSLSLQFSSSFSEY